MVFTICTNCNKISFNSSVNINKILDESIIVNDIEYDLIHDDDFITIINQDKTDTLQIRA